MRGTWEDVNRRLVGALLALDLHDALVITGPGATPRGLFRRSPGRQRLAQVTAAQTVLIAECWPRAEEHERALVAKGWEPPWQDGSTALTREAPLAGAPRLALSVVRALEVLGCEVGDLEVELTREEP